MESSVRASVRYGESYAKATGQQGFIAMPIVYTVLQSSVTSSPDLTNGDVRLVVTNQDLTIMTPLSPPISFSVLGDVGTNNHCVKLSHAQFWHNMPFGDKYATPRKPAVMGGTDLDGLTAYTNLIVGNQQLLVNSTRLKGLEPTPTQTQ